MVKKQNEIFKKLINVIYKFRFIAIFSVCIFCKGQEVDIINKPFSLEKYSEKISNDDSFTFLQSKKFKKIFNENCKYFIQKGWQKIGQSDYTVTELVASNETDLSKIESKRSTIYLFITGNKILKDTLKIKKNFDYSICQLDKENRKIGLAVGKYTVSAGNEFFEIHHLYQIDNEGKIKKIKLSTTVFDCPAPSDYVKDEEPESYTFGVVGGKKLNRYWYENSLNNQ